MKKILILALILGVLAGVGETAIGSKTEYYPAYSAGATTSPATYSPYSTNYPPPTPAPISAPAPIPVIIGRPTLGLAIIRSNGSLWSELTISRGIPLTTWVVESSSDLKTWSRVAEVRLGIFGGKAVKVPFENSAPRKFFRLVK